MPVTGKMSPLLDVEVEPVLLPFDNELPRYKSANRSTEARLDIKVRGFWTSQKEAFFGTACQK